MYPSKPLPRESRKDRALKERAESLTGTRSGVGDEKRAVTQEEAAQLGIVTLRAAYVTAAPTAAQHNALVDDIRAIAATLNAMGAKFTGL